VFLTFSLIPVRSYWRYNW